MIYQPKFDARWHVRDRLLARWAGKHRHGKITSAQYTHNCLMVNQWCIRAWELSA
jgi:hypothetical protein